MPASGPFDAILPAGGRISAEFAAKVGTDVKALIRFRDETILGRTIKAVRETGQVRRVVAIGGEAVRKEATSQVDQVLGEGVSGPDNILRGLKSLLAQEDPPLKVLVVTTDLPLISAEILSRYIAQCPGDKDISVPLISKQAWLSRFPGCSATFATLGDGSWTTGCAYVIDVGALESSMPHIQRVFDNRKSIFGMAKLLGPTFLFKLVTKTLNVPDVELKIQSMLGCTGAAVRNAPPELAYDIDDLDDYEYAVQHCSNDL